MGTGTQLNTSTENIITQRKFRSIIHYFKTFSHVQDCEQYIRQKTKDDRIFLIVNGRFGQEIVPRIHQFRQIFSIYVYYQDKEKNEEWAKKFIKVSGVFNKLEILINRVQSDYIKRIQYKVDDSFPLNICKKNNLSNNLIHDEFFHSQLLVDYLVHMKTLYQMI
ncbi:unnamed protein product [Rotaria sp. Silwood1]|nr:unnamed protein product [Rotaria sp. Silwood1]CAF3561921.1 unnamed protein product [Rotaria sp. Silwood1]CAF4746917.1 unnamed protein product [Rotaria sp. Silwood1]